MTKDQRHVAPHPVRTWFVQISSFLPGDSWGTVGPPRHHGESKWSHLPLVPSHCVSQNPVTLLTTRQMFCEPKSTHLNLQVLPWCILVWLLSLVNISLGAQPGNLGRGAEEKSFSFSSTIPPHFGLGLPVCLVILTVTGR